MFVKKTRHLVEFTFVLIVVGLISLAVTQFFGDAPLADDLDFDLDSDMTIESLIDQ